MTPKVKTAKDPAAVKAGQPITGRHPHQPLAKWQPVEVVWDDAWEQATTYHSDDLVEKCKTPCIRRSLGYLIVEDGTQILIVSTDDRGGVHGDSHTDGDCTNPLRINSGMVKEVIELVPRAK